MAGPFSVHATRSIDLDITTTDAASGNPETAATVTPTSGRPDLVRVGVRPDDPRKVFVDGLAPTSSPVNVSVSVTEGGQSFTTSALITVNQAPNLGSISIGNTASAEYVTPASR